MRAYAKQLLANHSSMVRVEPRIMRRGATLQKSDPGRGQPDVLEKRTVIMGCPGRPGRWVRKKKGTANTRRKKNNSTSNKEVGEERGTKRARMAVLERNRGGQGPSAQVLKNTYSNGTEWKRDPAVVSQAVRKRGGGLSGTGERKDEASE